MSNDFSSESLNLRDFSDLYGQVPDGDFRNANFSNCNLQGEFLKNVDFTGADFSNAEINGARFESCIFVDANFAGSKLEQVRIEKSDVKRVNWEGCEIKNSEFVDSDLSHGQFISAKIFGNSLFSLYSSFRHSIVNQCVFETTDLATIKFIDCQLDNTVFQNSQMRDVIFESTNLRETQIKNINFKGSIYRADLSDKSLVSCDFSEAHCGIDFSYSDLSGVSFRNANLGSCDFRGSLLEGTDFSFAKMRDPIFGDKNFRQAIFFENDVTKMNFNKLSTKHAEFFNGLLNEFLNSDSQVKHREWESEHREKYRSNLIARKNSDGEFIGYVEEITYERGRAYIWDPFKDSYREYD